MYDIYENIFVDDTTTHVIGHFFENVADEVVTVNDNRYPRVIIEFLWIE